MSPLENLEDAIEHEGEVIRAAQCRLRDLVKKRDEHFEDEINKWREAFETYGYHDSMCTSVASHRCNCGYTETMRKLYL